MFDIITCCNGAGCGFTADATSLNQFRQRLDILLTIVGCGRIPTWPFEAERSSRIKRTGFLSEDNQGIDLRSTNDQAGKLKQTRFSVTGTHVVGEPDQALIEQFQRPTGLSGSQPLRTGPAAMNTLQSKLAEGADIFDYRT